MKAETFNEFDFYEPSSVCQEENGLAVVVRKRPDYVLMYILKLGELCVLLRRHAKVGSVAEFDAKFELAEFYDISFVPVAEQKEFGRRTIQWMCTDDDFQLNQSDWMQSRVFVGGFVQVFVCCNFIDENLTKFTGDYWTVSTDLGPIVCKKSFFNEFYGTAVDLWVTFVKGKEGCHWKVFDTDNHGVIPEVKVQKLVNSMYDSLHTETTSTPPPSLLLPHLEHAFERFFDDMIPRRDHSAQMNVHDGNFTFTVDVSGFRPEEIKMEMDKNVIVISGEHREQKYHESVHRQFTRRVLIPEGIKSENIVCGVENGRLCIFGTREGGRTNQAEAEEELAMGQPFMQNH
ncbi:hypothetical protein niasHT_028544 [Heterodera trifolii]|uniref:SHSP domain-containing protein n=1 Tax=Heterodera trifolii TaxID=157864 RepID=A0ABD2KQL9_9BILA